MTANIKPIYDEKVKEVLSRIASGEDFEKIAEEMGYKTHKSLDIYMRRKNFRYHSTKKTYVPVEPKKQENLELPSSTKVAQIISLLSKEGADPKTVAKRVGFTDYKDMANHMKAKGYHYCNDTNNYILTTGEVEAAAEVSTSLHTDMQEYMEILEILKRNKAQLLEFIMPESKTGRVPRYVVGGIFVTKSVHMSSLLDQLVRNFAEEKNINQREIFEVALIEFFKKYGFEREIQTLLAN